MDGQGERSRRKYFHGSRLGGFRNRSKIKIGYFMTFKVLKDDAYKVAIFDYSMIEIVKKCPQHDPSPCHDARVKAGTGNLC
jgi:hypothetical protein